MNPIEKIKKFMDDAKEFRAIHPETQTISVRINDLTMEEIQDICVEFDSHLAYNKDLHSLRTTVSDKSSTVYAHCYSLSIHHEPNKTSEISKDNLRIPG